MFLANETIQKNYHELIGFQFITFTEKNHILQQGIMKVQLINFSEIAELSQIGLSELLAVSDRTLHNWTGAKPLAKCYGDRFIMYVHIFSLVYFVFNDRALANTWIKSPCRWLGFRCPLEVMECYSGILAVEAEIRRLRIALTEREHKT